jgi:hypothetical protein
MITDLTIEEDFARSYEVQILSQLPHEGHLQYYYPGAALQGGTDGVIVRVIPHTREPWIGIFASGTGGLAHSGVYTCPNENFFCVVANGEAYLVCAENPQDYEQIPVSPVLGVRPFLEEAVLIFCDYGELAAYDRRGLIWISDRMPGEPQATGPRPPRGPVWQT